MIIQIHPSSCDTKSRRWCWPTTAIEYLMLHVQVGASREFVSNGLCDDPGLTLRRRRSHLGYFIHFDRCSLLGSCRSGQCCVNSSARKGTSYTGSQVVFLIFRIFFCDDLWLCWHRMRCCTDTESDLYYQMFNSRDQHFAQIELNRVYWNHRLRRASEGTK